MGRRRKENLGLPDGVHRVRSKGRTYYYYQSGRSTARAKLVNAGICLVGGLFFLFMYNVRDHLDPASRYAAQAIYVASEYFVAFACFAYPLTSYREARHFFRVRADMLRGG